MKLSPAIAAGLLAATWLLPSAAAQPTLSRAVPAGFPPGKTTEFTLHGAKLSGATAVWTSFGAEVEIVADKQEKPDAARLQLRITPAEDLPVQIGALVVATGEGATAPLLVMIDDLPSVAESGKSTSAETAQAISTLTAVDGVSQAGSGDVFSLEVKEGQKVSFEAVAQRLGSKFDPVLWLRDADGHVLRLADDDPGLGGDCRFSHTFEKAGRYLLEVRDNAYRPGLVYRLRVGDFPIVSTPYPLAVQGGTKTRLGFAGSDADDAAPGAIEAAEDDGAHVRSVAARRKGGKSSALVKLIVSDVTEVVEGDADGSTPSTKTAPLALNGRLANPGERDTFSFAANKGDKFAIHAFGRSLGSPALLSFQVQGENNAPLAETPFDASGEPRLSWTCPADGDYTLSVRDLLDRGGPEFTYRVSVEPARADFAVSVKAGTPIGFDLPAKDAYLAIDLVCDRQGYNGPIQLGVEGPGRWGLQQSTIREKAKDARLLLVPEKELEPGKLFPLKIVATATIDDQTVRRTAGTLAVLRAGTPELLYPPEQLDGWVNVGVKGPAKPLFELPIPKDGVTYPRGSEEVKFTLTPKRIDKNHKSNLTLKLEGLPRGFSYRLKVDGKAPKEKYELTLRGPKDAETAEHELHVLAFGDIGGVGQVVRQTVKLHVAEPQKEAKKKAPEDEPEPDSKSQEQKKPESNKG
jgi:hypothetical protein